MIRRCARLISVAVLSLGIVALLVPLFLPPAPVLPHWSAFVPFVALGLALAITKAPGDLRFLFVVSMIVVSVGTWVYWDSMRFNRVFSWQAFGLISRYVPMFQLALALPALGYACWRWCRSHGNPSI